ncbi:hypothetical protein FACS189473_3580 [Spirochaetia bacterium]|nr:hypothetical protein FACS189473_3580 [Spirochaetia bacterium]
MLSVVFGLMVAGCKTEPEEEFDPSGGKTVEEKYWGKYTTNWEVGLTITLSEKKFVSENPADTIQPYTEDQAWTDGVNLYIYHDDHVGHYGIFTSDTSFYRASLPDWISTKVDE